ncbi:MAG: hypothetical protein LCH89_15050 [Proteobacteria bacterium]|nr:hypothetical protein [Pseudomonadota bacterium]
MAPLSPSWRFLGASLLTLLVAGVSFYAIARGAHVPQLSRAEIDGALTHLMHLIGAAPQP